MEDNKTYTYRADADANFYTVLAENNWVMSIQQNGEIMDVRQNEIMNMICQAPIMKACIQEIYNALNSGKTLVIEPYGEVHMLFRRILSENHKITSIPKSSTSA